MTTCGALVKVLVLVGRLDLILTTFELVHGVRQVVIVAAGMDTRVFRLGLDENHVVFELDFKQVLQYKADRIHHAEGEVKPTCKYIPLGVDLTVPG